MIQNGKENVLGPQTPGTHKLPPSAAPGSLESRGEAWQEAAASGWAEASRPHCPRSVLRLPPLLGLFSRVQRTDVTSSLRWARPEPQALWNHTPLRDRLSLPGWVLKLLTRWLWSLPSRPPMASRSWDWHGLSALAQCPCPPLPGFPDGALGGGGRARSQRPSSATRASWLPGQCSSWAAGCPPRRGEQELVLSLEKRTHGRATKTSCRPPGARPSLVATSVPVQTLVLG